jgi:hypothetical protein
MKFRIFENFTFLNYGISEKSDGAMKLGDNRREFFQRQRIKTEDIIGALQIHSANVVKVNRGNRGQTIPQADGLVTGGANLFLTVTVADCFPVYFFNPVLKTISLVHSGWRGTAANIAGRAIKVIGGDPVDILAGIGPGIQACHFEVQKDVLPNFAKYQEAIINRGAKIFIDLPLIIKQQLIKSGLKEENIESCGECTFCSSDKYFSFRRDPFGAAQGRPERSRGGDKPVKIQSMVAYIASF